MRQPTSEQAGRARNPRDRTEHREQDQQGRVHCGVLCPMPNRGRVPYLALGGVIAVLGGHAEARDIPWSPRQAASGDHLLAEVAGAGQPQEGAPNKQAHAEHAPADEANPSTFAKPYKPYADKYADSCYNAEDHDTADLCAQWRAALAAEKAADAAALGNIISGSGAFLSFVSIILVLIALGQSRKANRIAHDTYVADLRPWIFHTKVTPVKVLDQSRKAAGYEFTIEWLNVGRSPAIICIIWGGFFARPKELDIETLEFPRPDSLKGGTANAPGVPFDGGAQFFDIDNIVAATQGGGHLFI
jgi:hypothetical protein